MVAFSKLGWVVGAACAAAMQLVGAVRVEEDADWRHLSPEMELKYLQVRREGKKNELVAPSKVWEPHDTSALEALKAEIQLARTTDDVKRVCTRLSPGVDSAEVESQWEGAMKLFRHVGLNDAAIIRLYNDIVEEELTRRKNNPPKPAWLLPVIIAGGGAILLILIVIIVCCCCMNKRPPQPAACAIPPQPVQPVQCAMPVQAVSPAYPYQPVPQQCPGSTNVVIV